MMLVYNKLLKEYNNNNTCVYGKDEIFVVAFTEGKIRLVKSVFSLKWMINFVAWEIFW